MRQLTGKHGRNSQEIFSKLPMRQLTVASLRVVPAYFSKLPMRQLTAKVTEEIRALIF